MTQTEVKELPNIIKQSRLHIGGDSGITHLAGAVKTPTITIAGGSDPSLFGWHKVNSNKHILIQHELKLEHQLHIFNRTLLANGSRAQVVLAHAPDRAACQNSVRDGRLVVIQRCG